MHCIAGAEKWSLDWHLPRDGRSVYVFFTGTNLITHSVVGDIGQPLNRISQTNSSPDGGPANYGMENGAWLAFCSATYFKHKPRSIPMPFRSAALWAGPTYSNRVVAFNDTLGLPRSLDLYSERGEQVCHYEVLESTNINGWSFPLRFRLTQSRGPGGGGGGRLSYSGAQLLLTGQVTSIKKGSEPQIPNWPKLP